MGVYGKLKYRTKRIIKQESDFNLTLPFKHSNIMAKHCGHLAIHDNIKNELL